MSLIPKGGLRARLLPRFPANLIAGNGISIIKDGQKYTISVAEGFLVDGDKGDIIVSNGGFTWLIQDQAVTPAKHQHIGQGSFLARASPGTGPVQVLSSIDATAQLQIFSGTLKGLVPASGGGTNLFLRADGQFATPPGGAMPFPAGGNNEIQYNIAGNWAADPEFKWIPGAGLATAQNITITRLQPALILNKTSDTFNGIVGQKNGVARWFLSLGDNSPDPGGGANTGSHFSLHRYSDAGGSPAGTPILINRQTSLITLQGDLTLTNSSIIQMTGGGQTSTQGVGGGYINPGGPTVQWTVETNGGLEGGLYAHEPSSAFYMGSWSNHAVVIRSNNANRVTISPAGLIRFDAYTTAGMLVTDASGNITVDTAGVAGKVNRSGDQMTGVLTSKGTTGTIAAQTADATPTSFQIINTTGAGNAAHMAFHRGGAFIGYLGIDTDNLWKVGGGSHGAVAHQIWHAGSFNPASKVDIAGGAGALMTGQLTVTIGTAGVNYPVILNHSGNALKWAHGNPNIIGSLGFKDTSGSPFIALMAELGTTADTFRNSGLANAYGFVITHNAAQTIDFLVSTTNTAGTNFGGSVNAIRITAPTGLVSLARGVEIVDGATPILAGQGGAVTIDFAGPGNNNGIVIRHRIAGVAQAISFVNNSGTSAGTLTINGTTVALTSASDIRLKKDIVPFKRAREIVTGIAVHEHGWKDRDGRDVGIVAQEAYEVFPQSVFPGDPWMLNAAAFIPVLMAAVKELYGEVERLRRAT